MDVRRDDLFAGNGGDRSGSHRRNRHGDRARRPVAGQNAHRRALQDSAPEAFCATCASTTTPSSARIRFSIPAASARDGAGGPVCAAASGRGHSRRRAHRQFRGSEEQRGRTKARRPCISRIWATRRWAADRTSARARSRAITTASHKHETKIGNRVFIGSDTALVAPVRVGDGAYVAAGSIITENVPADALAIARGRQVNKPGWAAKRRAEMKRAANAKPSKPKRRKAKPRHALEATRHRSPRCPPPRAKSRRATRSKRYKFSERHGLQFSDLHQDQGHGRRRCVFVRCQCSDNFRIDIENNEPEAWDANPTTFAISFEPAQNGWASKHSPSTETEELSDRSRVRTLTRP